MASAVALVVIVEVTSFVGTIVECVVAGKQGCAVSVEANVTPVVVTVVVDTNEEFSEVDVTWAGGVVPRTLSGIGEEFSAGTGITTGVAMLIAG